MENIMTKLKINIISGIINLINVLIQGMSVSIILVIVSFPIVASIFLGI